MSKSKHKTRVITVENLNQMARKATSYIHLSVSDLRAEFGFHESKGTLWNQFATESFDHRHGQFGKELVIALTQLGIADAEFVVRAHRVYQALHTYSDERWDELTEDGIQTLADLKERVSEAFEPLLRELREDDTICDLLSGDEQTVDHDVACGMISIEFT